MEFPEQYKKAFEEKMFDVIKLVKEMYGLAGENIPVETIKLEQDGFVITIGKKQDVSDGDDVFGVLTSAIDSTKEIVILKSRAIKQFINDGMTVDEANEYYYYNVEGCKGSQAYSVVDDELSSEEIKEYLEEDESLIDPPNRKDGK